MKTWYEVFIDNNIETRTLQICCDKEEAEETKTELQKRFPNARISFDKWQDINNPTIIKED